MEGVFIAIGHKPNTDIFKGKLDMKDGYLTMGWMAMLQRLVSAVYLPLVMWLTMSTDRRQTSWQRLYGGLDAERFLDQ